MIYLLINSVLPVAILVLLGFIATKRNTFTYDQSLALLKYVGVIAVPVLTFKMIVSVNLNDINWLLLFSYVSSEILIYLFAGLIAKYIFKLEWTEAILIAMAASFSNHILFVYPIALTEYNDNLLIPIVSIISFDVIFLVFNIIILDLITIKKITLKKIIVKQFNNLPLFALIIGLIIVYFEIKLPLSLSRSINFISLSAAPCALFAAGIILANQIEKTQKNISNLIIIFKILLHPLLAIFIIWIIHDISFDISETTIMVASAPVGLMALIFSTQYGVKPNAISRAILITTILSIITIPLSGSLS